MLAVKSQGDAKDQDSQNNAEETAERENLDTLI